MYFKYNKYTRFYLLQNPYQEKQIYIIFCQNGIFRRFCRIFGLENLIFYPAYAILVA